MTAKVSATIDISASVEMAFAAMIDLASQDKWIIATRLFALEGAVEVPAVGSQIAALTGFAGIGVLDTMTVTVYDPPYRWETSHTGSAIKGIGIFTVEPGPKGSRVTWAEELELPFGRFGLLGWQLARPIVRWALWASLRRLRDGVASGQLPPAAHHDAA